MRKWAREAMAAMCAVERREPSCEMMCSVVQRDQTEAPATRQRDSVERAAERRRESSRVWVRCGVGSVDLGCERVQYCGEVGGGRGEGG